MSGLPDTISGNESRMKEKSENIGDMSVIYRYIEHNIGYKIVRGANTLYDSDFSLLTDISADVGDIYQPKINHDLTAIIVGHMEG